MEFIKKISGLVLLFGGLAIIIYGLYSSYGIFTAKEEAPVVFETLEQPGLLPKGASLDIQAQLQQALGEQFKNFLPADSMPKLLNLISWSIFAGILILGGGQIAGLGIKLIK